MFRAVVICLCLSSIHGTDQAHTPKRQKRFDWISGSVGDVASSLSCQADTVAGSYEPPTFTNCPPANLISEYLISDGSEVMVITWIDPVATDNAGNTLSVEPVVGSPSGSVFQGAVWGREHTVVYTATDSAGLISSCKFSFKVTVSVCASLQWPENGHYVCSHGYQIGSTCTFACNAGYQLSGPTTSSCNAFSWTATPTCEKVSCGAPSAIVNGHVSCGDDVYTYGALCTLGCNAGFKLQGSLYTSCGTNGTWVTAKVTTCIDDEPPNIFCKSPQIFYADRRKTSTVVTPEVPVATDNHVTSAAVVKVSGPASGVTLSTGTYHVSYKAVDSAGNESPACKVELRVKELTCGHPLDDVSDNDMEFTCTGYSYGDECALDCYRNLPLEGTDLLTCQRNDTGTTISGYWSWGSGSKPYCRSVACNDLDPPMNGSLTFSKIGYRRAATMTCDDPFSVPSMGEFFSGLTLCHPGGWSPAFNRKVPDCVLTKPAVFRYMTELFYYSGDCSDPVQLSSYQADLETKVDQASIQLTSLCPANVTCTALNPTLSCIPARRKRSTSGKQNINGHIERVKRYTREGVSEKLHTRYKRQTNTDILILDFEVESEFDFSSMDQTEMFNYVDALQTDTINPGLQGMLDNGDFDLSPWTFRADSLQSALGDTYCDPGFVVENVRYCSPCPRGYYLSGGICVECPVGQYASEGGSASCTSCPSQYSTRLTASESLDSCIKMCSPGTYSPDTFEPCASCPTGYYQNETAQVTCVKCPAGTTSLAGGSTTDSDCQDFDVLLGNTGGYIELSDISTLQDLTLMVWMKTETDSVPNVAIDINNVLIVEVATQLRVYTPTLTFNEILDTVSSEAWIHVTVSWDTTTTTLSVYVNGQLAVSNTTISPPSVPLVQNGHIKILSDGASGVFLSGLSLRDEVISATDVVNMATSCRKLNNGDVVNIDVFSDLNIDGVTVIAPSTCDAIDECQSSPCGSHRCYNDVGGYSCTCYGGWAGATCTTPPDYCDTNDCVIGAVCVSGSTNYTCQCQTGYAGTLCEQAPIDGGLSAWTPWSECNADCDTGTRSRVRYCDSPVPDTHGNDCVGNMMEVEACNTDACQVCSALTDDAATGFQCSTDVTSGLQTCTIQCNDGYVMPRGIGAEEYTCGLDTGYVWEPREEYVHCVAPVIPSSVTLTSHVRYLNAIPAADTRDAITAVEGNIVATDCFSSPTCHTDVTGGSNEMTLVSTILLQNSSHPNFQNYVTNGQASSSLQALINATSTLESTAEYIRGSTSSVLDVTVTGVTYLVDPTSLTMCVDSQCEPGFVPTNGLCAECPRGSYQSGDVCELCATGSYQDLSGQTTCTSCPTSTTTSSVGSTALDQCSAPSTQSPGYNEEEQDNTIIYALVGVVLLLVVVVAFCLVLGLKYFKRKYQIHAENNASGSTPPVFYNDPPRDSFHSNRNGGLDHNIPAVGLEAAVLRGASANLKRHAWFSTETKSFKLMKGSGFNTPAMEAWGQHENDYNEKKQRDLATRPNFVKRPVTVNVGTDEAPPPYQKNESGTERRPAPPSYSASTLTFDDLESLPRNQHGEDEFNITAVSPPPPYDS